MPSIKIEIKTVKLSEIRINPDNPRTITEKDMIYLVKSLQDFPDMMKLREIVVDEDGMIIGGNMRYLGLQKIGAKDCVAKIVKGLTAEQKREFIIRDNTQYGIFDYDILANEWGDIPLAEWGVNIPKAWTAEPEESESAEDEPEEPQIITCPKCKYEFSIMKEIKK